MSHTRPLSERMRPAAFDDFLGQTHLLDPSTGSLARILKHNKPASIVFWGPPGCGKTTLARLYLQHWKLPFETLHSTTTGSQDFKRVIEQAQKMPLLMRPTLLWVDEVHRLTRPQQDLLLPCIEDGSIILVAATTENPSFQLNRALLSRIQVMTLQSLSLQDLQSLVDRVENKLGTLPLTQESKNLLCRWANGDARALLNSLENLSTEEGKQLTPEDLAKLLQKRHFGIDHTGEGRYQLISALHKSVRGSDCQAALYWFSRMVTAGEDMRYIARRLIRMATEDIGLADPQALTVALHALKTYEILGSPEGDLALAEALIYLALAPKSNSLYTAYKKALQDAENTHNHAVPMHLINAATDWMQKEGYGSDYIYEHDLENAISGQRFFPDTVEDTMYYAPVERGFERELCKRISYFTRLKNRCRTHTEEYQEPSND